MGMTKENVIKVIGKPSNIKSVGEYGEVFEYDDTNYSVEINQQNKLSSIKYQVSSIKYQNKRIIF